MTFNMFYDTNCFSEIDYDDLSLYTLESNNFIVSSVLQEVREGYKQKPSKPGFSLILDNKRRLINKFKLISVEKVIKDPNYCEYDANVFLLKKNPLFCSAYYTWLPSAINPATPTSKYRHLFNNILWLSGQDEGDTSDLREVLGHIRNEEAEEINSILYKLYGKPPGLDYKKALKLARKKRMKDFLTDRIKLCDYQNVTASLLTACIFGQNTFLLTTDYDLIDIKENLMISIMEKYIFNTLIEQRLILDETLKRKVEAQGVEISITCDEIENELSNLVNRINKTKNKILYSIQFYNQNNKKVYFENFSIPYFLRDFIIQFKSNINCYSIQHENELKYRTYFSMDPNRSMNRIFFNLKYRSYPFYPGFLYNCEENCKYSYDEQNNQKALTDFI